MKYTIATAIDSPVTKGYSIRATRSLKRMPTILRKNGFRVVIYFDDHLPAHVHVMNADSEVKIDLGSSANPPQIIQLNGKRGDAVKALELVTAHQNELLEAWRQIHGEP